jgi:hypothetical protein
MGIGLSASGTNVAAPIKACFLHDFLIASQCGACGTSVHRGERDG